MRKILASVCLVCLVLTGCSRTGFPVGSWKISEQALLASSTSIVVLRPDHSGTIDVQAQALLDSENNHSALKWNYSGDTLQLFTEGAPAAISLVLVTRSETNVMWRGPDGNLVEWQKMSTGE
jgi:hypothetical protein